MATYSIAEAQERLPDLLQRAAQGEEVILTDSDRSFSLLARGASRKPIDVPSGQLDVAWLRRHRVGRLDPTEPDAGELVSRMRDEEWQ